MEKYFLFALRTENGIDFETIYQKVFSSSILLQDNFYTLVGQCSSSFSQCSVECFDTAESPYLKKVRISSGDVRIYVYLQKLS